ncbi:MAG: DUF1844 domain-containing protein [Candidatus Hydrogenedentes bacterium]|nr:DUF1844 domain-containing protein [Candidatus Hydrogenedentota bacterium]
MADDDKPKIIIDEDWKTQVQREKEEARKKAEEAPKPEEKAAPEAEEASFEGLVSGLAMQAMIALGVLAPRDAKEVMIDLRGAKYVIDLLIVLRDKTKGNLTPEEQGYVAESLADLQQTYVLRSQQLQEAALRQAGIDPNLKP